jgi:phosphoglycerate kinase
MKVRSLREARELSKKRILVRIDANVPLKGNKILDDFKIRQSLATIDYLLKKNAQIFLVSHLGRPSRPDPRFSLKPVASFISRELAIPVTFTTLEKCDKKMPTASVVFLENIRFYPGEEKNNPAFAKRLATLADVFVLDGFGVAHRDAASVSGVAKLLPSYAGFLLEAEINGLNRVLTKPKKPLVVILGGAKMETKIPVLTKLLPLADTVLVGGGIANTYYLSQGSKVGNSLVQKQFVAELKKLAAKKKILFPIDAVYGTADGKKVGVVSTKGVFKLPPGTGIYDIGPATIQKFAAFIRDAETIVWNGALGLFEQKPYQYGTYMIAELLSRRSKGKAFGVAGGGETVEVLEHLKLVPDIDLVSTGGGAMLEYLSGKRLPGIIAVSKK